jgi:hypothetical protein
MSFFGQQLREAQAEANNAKYQLENAIAGKEASNVVSWDPVSLPPPTTGETVAITAIAAPAFPVALLVALLATSVSRDLGVWAAVLVVVAFFWYSLGFLIDRRLSCDTEFSAKRLNPVCRSYLGMLLALSPLVLLFCSAKFLFGHYGTSFWESQKFQLSRFPTWYEDRNLWFVLVLIAWSAIGTVALIKGLTSKRINVTESEPSLTLPTSDRE